MRSSIVRDFIQVATLLTVSVGSQLMAQAAPASQQNDTPPSMTEQQSAEQVQKAILLRDRALYGSQTLFNIFTQLKFEAVRQHLEISDDDLKTIKDTNERSSIFKKMLHTVRLSDYINATGEIDSDVVSTALEKLTDKPLRSLITQGASLDDAMKSDSLFRDIVSEQTKKIVGISLDSTNPVLREVARGMKMNEIFMPDGSLKEDPEQIKGKISARIAEAIWDRPLTDLAKPELAGILDILKKNTNNSNVANWEVVGALMDVDSFVFRAVAKKSGPPLSIGDILVDTNLPQLKFDEARIETQVVDALRNTTLAELAKPEIWQVLHYLEGGGSQNLKASSLDAALLHTFFDTRTPVFQAVIDKTPALTLGDVLTDTYPRRLQPDMEKIKTHIAEALWDKPLAKLVRQDMVEVLASLNADAVKRHEAKEKDAPDPDDVSKFFSEPSAGAWTFLEQMKKPTIGDILKDGNPRHLQLDAKKLSETSKAIAAAEEKYVYAHTLSAAKSGVSAYDFLKDPDDTTGLFALHYSENLLISYIKQNQLPDSVTEHLKQTKMSDVIREQGKINVDVLRDKVLESINQSVYETDDNLLAALGTEIATVKFSLKYHPDDSAVTKALKNTKLASFVSGGDASAFEFKQLEFGTLYPLEKRALDVTQYSGPNGEKNPWKLSAEEDEQLRQQMASRLFDITSTNAPVNPEIFNPLIGLPPSGTASSKKTSGSLAPPSPTFIPFSFDVQNKALVGLPGIDNPHPLTEAKKAYFRYTAWELTVGTCGIAVEMNALPEIERKNIGAQPLGVFVYGANTDNVPVNGNYQELGNIAGVSSYPNPFGQRRGDIALRDVSANEKKSDNNTNKALKDSYADDIDTNEHEGKHVFYIQSHTFDSIRWSLPGTVNVKGTHSAPFLDGDISGTSYTGGSFYWITRTRADIGVGQSALGACPVNFGNSSNTITLHQGTQDDVVKNRDLSIAWVGSGQTFGQTMWVRPNAAFNFTKVGEAPVRLDESTPLDLTSTVHVMSLIGTDGKKYNRTRVDTVEPVVNAVITSGAIVAADKGTIEVKEGGILDAHVKGAQKLIGGNGGDQKIPTNFIGGPGRKTFIIHADPKNGDVVDTIEGYKPGDKIVAPAKTTHALISPVTIPWMDEKGVSREGPGWTVKFFGSEREGEIKSVTIWGRAYSAVALSSVAVTNTDGGRVTLQKDGEAAPSHSPTPGERMPAQRVAKVDPALNHQ